MPRSSNEAVYGVFGGRDFPVVPADVVIRIDSAGSAASGFSLALCARPASNAFSATAQIRSRSMVCSVRLRNALATLQAASTSAASIALCSKLSGSRRLEVDRDIGCFRER